MRQARFYYRDPQAPAPNSPIGVGALALIEEEGRLLLEKRSDCGRWGLIGGLVDPEEGIEEALTREVAEETGLTLRECELLCIITDPSRRVLYPDGNVVRLLSFVYLAKATGFEGLRPSEESLELRLFDMRELPIAGLARARRSVEAREARPEQL